MKLTHLLLLFLIILLLSDCAIKTQELRMNQIQIIGSHNSYKINIEAALQVLLIASDPKAKGLDYHHISIGEQLDLGLRNLELDPLYDPEGGKFAQPKGLQLLTARDLPAQPYDTAPMQQPGFKVIHIPDIDFRSHCPTFTGCLSEIKNWSQAHPNHLPIIITINPKSSGVPEPGFTLVTPFDKKILLELDKEILSVFNPEELITPLQVKAGHATLREGIIKEGWPLLKEVRGQVLFVLDTSKKLMEQYVEGDDTYQRPMFANVGYAHSHAAFFIINNPIADGEKIKEAITQGFMVRTRSDADTKEARAGDKSRFEAAIGSGAQVITTDYYLKSLSPNKDFEIIFPTGVYSRCNPLLAENIENCKLN